MSTRNSLLRLALAALDATAGPDVAGASALLRAALELREVEDAKPLGPPALATPSGFGTLVQATPRTVRRWLSSGRIPREAVTGKGRSMRIDVQRGLSALKSGQSFSAESAGASHVARRRTLKAVG